MPGKLFIVATPIGNPEDITFRAVKVLSESDFVICEDLKEARRLLAYLKLQKELITLNEHDEEENTPEIIEKIKNGANAALISDCGTPMFADPGHTLLENALSWGVKVVPIPGASSLTAALSVSGLHTEKFYYAGWLPVKKDARAAELRRLSAVKEVIILLETPYRLKSILHDAGNAFGKGAQAVLAYDLTLPGEKVLRGSLSGILAEVVKNNLKGEFVLMIDNRASRKPSKKR